MRQRPLIVGLLSTVVLAVGGPAVPAMAAPPGSALVTKINAYRTAHGAPVLVVDSRLSANGESWARSMAGAGRLAHQDMTAARRGWKTRGENVGSGPTVDQIFANLLASPSHRRNIVDRTYDRVGVGVVAGPNGKLYAAQEFGGGGDGTAAAVAVSRGERRSEAPPPPPVAVAPTPSAPAAPPPAEVQPPEVQPPAAPAPVALPVKPKRRLTDAVFILRAVSRPRALVPYRLLG